VVVSAKRTVIERRGGWNCSGAFPPFGHSERSRGISYR